MAGMNNDMLFEGMEPVAAPVSNVSVQAAPRLRRPDRAQAIIRPCLLEDLIEPDHPARTIWAVVQRLDLSGFYAPIAARGSDPGRAATDPALLIGLWLYAASEGVGSARQLAALCQNHAAYQWICGGVSINHHSLSDFRVGQEKALDDLFTQVLASLLDKNLVSLQRICQDGTRVRACAGASSFRRQPRLEHYLDQARQHVEALKSQMDDPAVNARQQAARQRAATERLERIEQAIQQLPDLEAARQKAAQKDDRAAKRQVRASVTDPESRRMRMADGGFRPAYNIQIAGDPTSRAIVEVDASNSGVDTEQGPPMREKILRRTGRVVQEQVLDGGYLDFEQLEQAAAEQKVILYVAGKPPTGQQRKSPYDPRRGDSPAIAAWRARMGSEAGQVIYRQRTATSETINADLKTYRGLGRLLVRGLAKVRCVVLWSALAYNLMHFAGALIG
jgi:transposase